MKAYLLTLAIMMLLIAGARDVRAQAYGPYYNPHWDLQYQQYLDWQQYLEHLRQTDPYYDLHVIHYQLYLQPYRSPYVYLPCCYTVGVPVWSAPAKRLPHGAKSRPPRVVKRR